MGNYKKSLFSTIFTAVFTTMLSFYGNAYEVCNNSGFLFEYLYLNDPVVVKKIENYACVSIREREGIALRRKTSKEGFDPFQSSFLLIRDQGVAQSGFVTTVIGNGRGAFAKSDQDGGFDIRRPLKPGMPASINMYAYSRGNFAGLVNVLENTSTIKNLSQKELPDKK